MAFIRRYRKGPTETEDYDIDFTDWLAARSDTIASYSVDCDDGITIVASERIGSFIRVWMRGGANGRSYRVRAQITTVGDGVSARTKLGDIQIQVRGQGLLEGAPVGGGTPWDSANPNEPFIGGGTPLLP